MIFIMIYLIFLDLLNLSQNSLNASKITCFSTP